MKACVAALYAVLMVGTAFAAGWTQFANPRFGVTIDVPPGFVGEQSDYADGRVFHSADGDTKLWVWGNNVVDASFQADALGRMQGEKEDGWVVSYESGNKTAGLTWHVYSGTKADRIVYVRSIESCKGTQALHFRLEYPRAQKTDYDLVVERLARSMKAGPAVDCP